MFPLRDGRLVDRYAFHLENVGGQDPETILEAFCLEYYGGAPSVPPQIVVPPEPGHSVRSTVPLRPPGVTRRGSRTATWREAPARRAGARERAVALEHGRRGPSRVGRVAWRRSRASARASTWRCSPPGSSASTSPTSRDARSSARWRSSRTPSRGSALPDVRGSGPGGTGRLRRDGAGRTRRFERLRDATSPERWDESFASVPDLVVVDGGRGQLSAALQAITSTFELPRTAVISLAKREEEVFVPGGPTAIVLAPRSGPPAAAADP